ncbi:hypothetical protein JX265_010030 [Neoarthrinium moseri]|uniref:CFEM domain-containing protein n=1 Tax=Neoarthrinium moseri TaxID=1658444 RepID=A0A9P9WF38_9PEZI|nr:uncharacterized protein JN550_012058 [Neoarthrinium moseri]KAI1844475.1 hypothetical protein JX266_009362 [Neoarthrinium moseri]KAI1859540.1 hypothetical protein JN550_012058 [Neoarthrinium moseri]KAI1860106.1 hypothetical protein JX265_010030 [Neoarthrinium moseri]
MKSSVAVIALAGAAAAGSIGDFVPKCAVGCLEDGVKSATPCAVDDLNCVCIADNYRNTYTAAVSCVLQSCGSDTAVGEVLPGAAHMCEVVLSSTFSSANTVTAGPTSTTATTAVTASTTDEGGFSIQTQTTAVPSTSRSSAAGSDGTSTAPTPTSSTAAAGASTAQAGFGTLSWMLLAALALI